MTLRRLLTGDATRTTTSPHRHGDQGRRSHIRGLQSLRSCRPLRGGGAQGSASQATTAVLLLGSAPVRVAAAPMLASSLLDTGCLPRLGTESEEADHLPTSVFTRSHCLASGRFSDCHRRRAALSSHAPGPRRTRCHGGRHGSSSSDTRGAVDVSAGVCSAGPRLGPGPRPDIRADAAGLLGSGGARGRSGDFGGAIHHGAPVGLLFPASIRFNGRDLLVTNLALELRLFGPDFVTPDSEWAAQVSRYTISKIRLSHDHGPDDDDDRDRR